VLVKFSPKSNARKKTAPCPASTGALVTLSSYNSVLGAKVPIVRASLGAFVTVSNRV